MKFRILLRSFNNELIGNASQQLRSTLIDTDCQLSGIVALPTRIKRFCVLRSPHVDKKSREQFEIRIHKRILDLKVPSAETFNALIKLDLDAGVDVEVKL